MDITLTSQEFTKLNNALCGLRGVMSHQLASVIHPNIVQSFRESFVEIDSVLAPIYAKKDADFDRKRDYYNGVGYANGLTSIWSMYAVEDFDAPHPWQDATHLYYSSSFSVPINGLRWLDLWFAANHVIKLSGDRHRIYIEDMIQREDDKTILTLQTGS